MRKSIIDKFRYYLFEPNPLKHCEKVIIIYHGWGSTAKGYTDLADDLSKEGYTVIVPEIVFHDTRQPLKNHFDRETMQDYFWKTVFESIDEFNEFFAEIGFKKEDIILVGSSMGGFIANGIFAREPNLFGLANINGSGSFVMSERLFREMDNREDISSEEKKILKEYDPIERKNCSSPVLLIHGDSDTIIPIEGQKNYYRYLQVTERRTNVEFNIHKKVNHQFTTDMIDELIIWLHKICRN